MEGNLSHHITRHFAEHDYDSIASKIEKKSQIYNNETYPEKCIYRIFSQAKVHLLGGSKISEDIKISITELKVTITMELKWQFSTDFIEI